MRLKLLFAEAPPHVFLSPSLWAENHKHFDLVETAVLETPVVRSIPFTTG